MKFSLEAAYLHITAYMHTHKRSMTASGPQRQFKYCWLTLYQSQAFIIYLWEGRNTGAIEDSMIPEIQVYLLD